MTRMDPVSHNQVERVNWLETIESGALARRSQMLTKWETDFLASMREQVDAGRPVTEKQGDILHRILYGEER